VLLLLDVAGTVVFVLLETVGTVTFVSLPLDVVTVGAALAQADKAITQIAITMLKIIFRFISILHL
jgi:hypothetical protein